MVNLQRTLTFLACAAFAAYVAEQARVAPISAADSNDLSWGATNPTWSPDSREIAFSLFASIWKVDSKGGQAEQVTASAGYHAHPAWSPDGASIAYISGSNPRGRFAKIAGRLMVVDVSSGREREIKTPRQTLGTPAWSPDSKKIVVGVEGIGGVLLHEVDVAGGAVRPIETRPQGNNPTMMYRDSYRRLGRWMEAGWSPDGKEVFYAGDRQGSPQLWSLPAGGPDFYIRKPLTPYTHDDIVNLDGVTALPSGDIVYSADLINGAGNFELYRIPADGGEPAALTETPRHELTPAASPDGKSIAFSSNQFGNIDLFVMPADGGGARHVAIDKLKFRGAAGNVRVKVVDEKGDPTPVRFYVEASDGKGYAPRGEPLFYYPHTPGPQRDAFFIGSGEDEFALPAGRVTVRAVKGVEYRLAERSIDIAAGQTGEITIQMERWTNWNQKGWYSGENHFHANYLGSYYQRPSDSLAWMKAMDMNAANMIVANAQGAFVHDEEFFTGELSSVSTDRRFLWWGQEYRNSDPLGHMGFIGINKLIEPFYTSVPGSDSPYDFLLNTMAAINAKRAGGLTTYMHPIGGTHDVFDTNLGAKEAVVTAGMGALDILDLLPYGESAYALWYGLLNCGVKISAGAGTDTFTNWRGINRIPGGSRQYVHVGGKMSWERWIERYDEGRSFATTGPLLELSVNGRQMGEQVDVADGQRFSGKLVAEVWSRTPLARMELIRNGKIIATREIDASARTFRLEHDVESDESCWYAVRVSGPPAPGLTGPARAHSGPVYVSVGSRPTLVREDLETAIRWTDRFWANLVERDNFGPAPNQARAKAMVDEARAHYWEKLDSTN